MLTRTFLKTSSVLASLLLVLLLAAPVRADQPNMQNLQGAWAGSNGTDTMLLMFMGNVCGLALNNQQMYGVWNLAGDRLDIQFQNGKNLSYSVVLQGDTLILDGNVQLTRQAMPNMPGAQPNIGASQGYPQGGQPGGAPQGGPWGGQAQGQPGGAVPGGGTWGGGQPQAQPGGAPQGGPWGGQAQGQPGGAVPGGGTWGGQPQAQPGGAPQGGPWGGPQQPAMGATPLEGSWSTQMPQGRLTFRFMGNRYAQSFNGQVMEEGTFNYLPDGRLQYQILSGQAAGQSGENRLMVNGNTLTFTWPNGMSLVFMRDSQ